jgi:hypothetical protein
LLAAVVAPRVKPGLPCLVGLLSDTPDALDWRRWVMYVCQILEGGEGVGKRHLRGLFSWKRKGRALERGSAMQPMGGG